MANAASLPSAPPLPPSRCEHDSFSAPARRLLLRTRTRPAALSSLPRSRRASLSSLLYSASLPRSSLPPLSATRGGGSRSPACLAAASTQWQPVDLTQQARRRRPADRHGRRALRHGDGRAVRGEEVPAADVDTAPAVPAAAGGEGAALGAVGGAARRVRQHRAVRRDHVRQQLPRPHHRLALGNSSSKNNFFIHEYGKLSTHAVQTMLLSQHLLIPFEQEIYKIILQQRCFEYCTIGVAPRDYKSLSSSTETTIFLRHRTEQIH
jgi:hypothetical protein